MNANALVIKPHDVDINSGVVEKRQAGAAVASGSLSVQQIPAVNPYVGRKTGSFTITTGFGAGQSGPLGVNVTNDGTITATFSVPTSTGVVPVAISGIVDTSTGRVTVIGTNSSTAAGTLILSLSGSLGSNGTGSGTLNLPRLQNGVATTVSSGTFRFSGSTSGSQFFPATYRLNYRITSETPNPIGVFNFQVDSSGNIVPVTIPPPAAITSA